MGQNLMSSGVESLNYQDLAAGIEDVLTKQQPKISYQEAQQVLNQFSSIKPVLPGVGSQSSRRSQG